MSTKQVKPTVTSTVDDGYIRRTRIQTVSVVSLDIVFKERQQCAKLIDYLRKEGLLIAGFNIKIKHPEQAYQTSKLADYFVDALIDAYDVSEHTEVKDLEEKTEELSDSKDGDSDESGSNKE